MSEPNAPATPAAPSPGDPPGSALTPLALPTPRIVQTRRPRLSLVWLVPLLALAIGASLVVRSIL